MNEALAFQGTSIRRVDDKLSLTDMWRAAGSDPSKRPVEWLRQESTATILETIGDFLKVGGTHLYETSIGKGGSTMAHWRVGLAYARYLSPDFYNWCDDVVRAHMEGRSPPAAANDSAMVTASLTALMDTLRADAIARSAWASKSEAAHEALARDVRDGFGALSKSQCATEAQVGVLTGELIGVKRELGSMARDITSIKVAERRDFRNRDKLRMRATVLHKYGGMCPCCRQIKIVETLRGQTNFAQYDHWKSRRRIEIEDGWLTCTACNQMLGEPGDEEKRASHRYLFNDFHDKRKDLEGRQIDLIPGGKSKGEGSAA